MTTWEELVSEQTRLSERQELIDGMFRDYFSEHPDLTLVELDKMFDDLPLCRARMMIIKLVQRNFPEQFDDWRTGEHIL